MLVLSFTDSPQQRKKYSEFWLSLHVFSSWNLNKDVCKDSLAVVSPVGKRFQGQIQSNKALGVFIKAKPWWLVVCKKWWWLQLKTIDACSPHLRECVGQLSLLRDCWLDDLGAWDPFRQIRPHKPPLLLPTHFADPKAHLVWEAYTSILRLFGLDLFCMYMWI